MAKAASLKIKLLSTADTGYFYVTQKNARTKTEKLTFKKYDPVARKHVEFKETKILSISIHQKNARTKTEKLTFKKYDPVARKHVEFKETKIK